MLRLVDFDLGRLGLGHLLRQSGDGEAEDEAPASPEDVVRGLFGQLLNNSRDSSEETPDEEDGGEQPN